ncbi:MAG: LytTR family DNA-binding domain-containing protein, partial [Bacteroidota bacterium]
LTENNFLRVHQSHLINLNYVKKYVRGEGGYVVMSDGSSVNVSVRKKHEVLEKLSHF